MSQMLQDPRNSQLIFAREAKAAPGTSQTPNAIPTLFATLTLTGLGADGKLTCCIGYAALPTRRSHAHAKIRAQMCIDVTATL